MREQMTAKDYGYNEAARYYDVVYAHKAPNDLPFYLELAARTGGPVLELGCGTGRIALPLAQAGHEVVALDASPRMLSELTAKLDSAGPEVRERVSVVEGTMEGFDLGRRFKLVISPFRAFQHLMTPLAQRSCLGAVRRHLADGGVFVFNAFNPGLRFIVNAMDRGKVWLEDFAGEYRGGELRRSYQAVYKPNEQVIEVIWRFEQFDAQGNLTATKLDHTELRWLYRYEVENLLELSGFEIEAAYSDYRKSPIDEMAGELLYVCKPSKIH